MRRMAYAACVVAMLGASGQAADVLLAKLTWLAGDWQVASEPGSSKSIGRCLPRTRCLA
jgi:hypothetical protein